MCSVPNPFDDATNKKLDERQKLICDLLSEKVTSHPVRILLQNWSERLNGASTKTIAHHIRERHKPNGNDLHTVAYYDASGEMHVAWVYSAIQDQNEINKLVDQVFQQLPEVLSDYPGIRGAAISEHKSQTA